MNLERQGQYTIMLTLNSGEVVYLSKVMKDIATDIVEYCYDSLFCEKNSLDLDYRVPGEKRVLGVCKLININGQTYYECKGITKYLCPTNDLAVLVASKVLSNLEEWYIPMYYCMCEPSWRELLDKARHNENNIRRKEWFLKAATTIIVVSVS